MGAPEEEASEPGRVTGNMKTSVTGRRKLLDFAVKTDKKPKS